jgi:hypothetical protein
MLRMARAMGDVGKPVQLAVHEALYRNPDYGWLHLPPFLWLVTHRILLHQNLCYVGIALGLVLPLYSVW